MIKLNGRQLALIEILKNNIRLSPSEIYELIGLNNYSRPTINRDLLYLLDQDLIVRFGMGRSVVYSINQNYVLKEYEVNNYFLEDFRTNIKANFNADIFDNLSGIFNQEERTKISELNEINKTKLLGQTTTGFKKELERLTIEFSWKSSSIEGNTYSLLESERLLKENIKAAGHIESEVQMIINHKNALAFIIEHPKYFKDLSIFKINEIHNLLAYNLDIYKGIRKTMVGITGTNFKPLDNEFSIKEALEKLIISINNIDNPVEKALVAVAMISYIQPFEDGNKRTARMLGNAILIANNYIPVSFVGVDSLEYKKAVILFYEQNSIIYFKKLFLEQYELSIKKYF